MQLEIITPEAKIFSGEATAVQFPGLDGLFQVLNNHAPIISSLKEGEVKVDLVNAVADAEDLNASIRVDEKSASVIYVKINGGVVEMNNNKIIVLAE